MGEAAAVYAMTNDELDVLAQRDETVRDLLAEAARLSTKSSLEYDRGRRAIAQQLGCRVSSLDAHIKERLRPQRSHGRGYLSQGSSSFTSSKILQTIGKKRELVVQPSNLPATVEDLRDLLANAERLFERGLPVRIVVTTTSVVPSALPLTKNNVVMEAHRLCQPVKPDKLGELVPVTLPDRVAQMYLDSAGEWNLRPLAGISLAPLLSRTGELRVAEGYDSETGLWCLRVPPLAIPDRPSRADAERGLRLLRQAFRTFPFADSVRHSDSELGIEVVDISQRARQDESAFLVALLTACCRSSLFLAPGLLITAPTISGAGTGKGLLARAICMIAFGHDPRAFTAGHNRDELEKRLAAEFIQAQPVVFLDNANGLALASDTLASVLTERPASVRVLGESRMAQLNSTAFVVITGNGLSVIEDLARRFLVCELDAHCEDPESRPFTRGFLQQIGERRSELLGAALTVWRWGRQNAAGYSRGRPLGSFEDWGEWCRDPLLALGCEDPVDRIQVLKAQDPKRLHVVEVFSAWWMHHQDQRVTVNKLAEEVQAVANPHNRGRQYLARTISAMVGTNAGGYVLTRQHGAGRWSASTYVLNKIEPSKLIGHRDHRGHRA
jgi:hypothetical protein